MPPKSSGRQRKRTPREESERPASETPPKRHGSPRVLIGAAILLALVIAGVVLALAPMDGSSDDEDGATVANGTTLEQAGGVAKLYGGIPQNGNVLGKASAPVTMVEYADIQCAYCRSFELEQVPQLIDRYVRTGQLKIVLRLIATLSADSQRARGAALAAAKQNKMFPFVELLYRHQGAENSGWVTDRLITSAAASVSGLDVARVLEERVAPDIAQDASEMDSQATSDAVQVTPTILVGKTGGSRSQVVLSSPGDYRSIADAIDNALGA